MIDIKENEQLSTLNHSCAHMMAQAVKRLYPQAKFWVCLLYTSLYSSCPLFMLTPEEGDQMKN